MRATAPPSVWRGMVETIVRKQGLLIKPVVGSKQGYFCVAAGLDPAYELRRLLQVPLPVVQAVDEAAVGQDGQKCPPVTLVCRCSAVLKVLVDQVLFFFG